MVDILYCYRFKARGFICVSVASYLAVIAIVVYSGYSSPLVLICHVVYDGFLLEVHALSDNFSWHGLVRFVVCTEGLSHYIFTVSFFANCPYLRVLSGRTFLHGVEFCDGQLLYLRALGYDLLLGSN